MTNDEGQMTNRWGRLKVSRRWVIVVAAVAIVSLLAYALFRKPAVTLEVIELKQELLRGFQFDSSDPPGSSRTGDLELQWVAVLELQNNSADEIQYSGYPSNPKMPDYECLYWTGGTWTSYPVSAADQVAWEDELDQLKRRGGGGGGGTGPAWIPAGLPAGGSLRFRVEFYEREKPSFVALPFRTLRSKIKFYDFLPDAVVHFLPWRKEWHQVESEVILNGATEKPPRWTKKPDINKALGR